MTALISLKTAEAAVGEKARELYALWRVLSDGRIAPHRADIKLRLVRNLTQWLWRVDVIDDGRDYLFRLNGDRIIQFYGHNFSGCLLSQTPQDAFAQMLWQALGTCHTHKRPQLLGPQPSLYAEKDFMEIEAIFLPLSEDGQNISGIIGTMEYWPVGTHSPPVAI